MPSSATIFIAREIVWPERKTRLMASNVSGNCERSLLRRFWRARRTNSKGAVQPAAAIGAAIKALSLSTQQAVPGDDRHGERQEDQFLRREVQARLGDEAVERLHHFGAGLAGAADDQAGDAARGVARTGASGLPR